ncbi:MAG: EamA family transporter RarD [Verrucomicrobiota bacterium]|nr:EamA family transporter RarD [Verrucomicrobiota bacterium]
MGYWATVAAFLCWGVFPLYWKLFHSMSAVELTAHRVVWGLLCMAPFLIRTHAGKQWCESFSSLGRIAKGVPSAVFLAINWGVYLWAVINGHVLDASLGYFLVPLLNTALGTLFLGEKLRPTQWFSVLLATSGVCWMVVLYGKVPWAALAIAGSWGMYGVIKKGSTVGALAGLAVEMTMMFPFAAFGLAWLHLTGTATVTLLPVANQWILCTTAGVITVVPLLFFIYGTKRIPLTATGIFQYLTPSMKFVLAVLLFNEPFSSHQMMAFAIIWTAIVIYITEGIWQMRKRTPVTA